MNENRNNYLNYFLEKEDINNLSFSHNNHHIQSVISRNKINSYKENNNKFYEDKGTDTNEDN